MGRSTSSLGQGLRMPKMNRVGKQTRDRPPTQASRARPRSWPRGASGGFWVGSDSLGGVLGSTCAGRSSEEEREGLEAKSGEEGRDQRGGAARRMLPRKSDTTTLMPRGSPGCPPRARRWAPRTPGHLEVFSCIWQIAEHPARARHNKESERWPLGPRRDTEKEDREVVQF